MTAGSGDNMLEDYPKCYMCKAPIFLTGDILPARRAATSYYNASRTLSIVSNKLCPRCRSNPETYINFIEDVMELKLMDYQKKLIVRFVSEANRQRLKSKKDRQDEVKLLGARFDLSNVDELE
jgi:hypothetical protein